jgi:hypothetical protein
MIGANKPSCEVTVDIMPASAYDWDTANAWHRPSTTYTAESLSVAKKSNGKLIVCNMLSGTVYEAECDSVEDLISGDDSAYNWTSTGITALGTGWATCFNIETELYMTFSDTGNGTAKQLIYKSPSGNGGDWVLYSTIQSYVHTPSTSYGGTNNYTGIPVVLESGRWVLCCGSFGDYGGALIQVYGAYTSDDKGITWTWRQQLSSAWYLTNCSKIPVICSTDIYVVVCSYYNGGSITILKSTDNSISWGSVLAMDYWNNTGWSSIISNANNGFYAYAQGLDTIWEWAEPNSNMSNYSKIADLPLIASGVDYMINIDNYILVISNNYVLGTNSIIATLPVKSINVSRNKNMAGSLNLAIDNKNGEWSPDNTVHQNVLFPNSEITIKQGYGSNLVQTFKGLIDRIEMTTFPQELKLNIRDKLKIALDQTITSGTAHVITYTAQTVEAIFTDLCSKAGLTAGTIETTGIILAEKTFSWETYADCFQWLADLVGFEYGADEEGLIYFKKDAIPQATDWILTFTDGEAQAYPHIVEGSETVKTSDEATTYIKDTDYTIDYETGVITSITIPDGQTLMSYVFASYSFSEGEDIISLGYTIDDNDLYSSVIVYGKDANDAVISAYKDYVSKDYYNVLPQKIMKIDVSEASTIEQLQAIADRAEMLMRSRVREVSFAAIAVPWLQVGDIIQVIENSTTISELYRITDLSTSMDSNGYTMQITCYHHSA